jgi:predicted nucleic acid-binding protein
MRGVAVTRYRVTVDLARADAEVPARASRPDAIGHQQAVLLIESFRRFPVQDITSGIMMAARDARQRFQLSYWDAAIIEASRAMGCAQVLSEDLSDGQDYGGVRVANPFR